MPGTRHVFLATSSLAVPALLLLACSSAVPSKSTDPATPELPFREGVRAVFEDHEGNFWLGSHKEGVCRFDGERLTHFTVADGLSDGQVRRIEEGPDGRIWFECGVGLSYFDGERIVTPTDRVHDDRDAWRTAPGDLWFKSDPAIGVTGAEEVPGIYRYDGESLRWLAFPKELGAADPHSHSVTGFARGAAGRLWFATYGAVIGYDGRGFEVFDDARLGRNDENGHLHVRCVFEDSRGRLWIGNNWIGAFVHDGATTVHFSTQQGLGRRADGSPGPLSRVFAITEDTEGHIWFGTVDQGAWRWDGEHMTAFGPAEGLTSRHVWSFYTDRQGRLWAAGADPSGAFRFDGERFVPGP